MSDNDKNNSLTALVAGIVIGAAVTYLFTTKEGRKLKEKLIEEGSNLLDKVKEGLEEVGDEVEEKGKAAVKEIENSAESAKEAVEEVVAEVPEHVKQLQKKGRKFFFSKKQSPSES